MSEMYDLCRRVEDAATELENRRLDGRGITKQLTKELFDIAVALKILDKNPQRR